MDAYIREELNMFGQELITRKCVLTLEGGYRIVATLTTPKPTQPIFQEELEHRFVDEINKKQPHLVNKVVKCHLLRN